MNKTISKISLLILAFSLFNLSPINTDAAYVQNNTNGTYTDDFADNTGLAVYNGVGGSTHAKVDTATGLLKLTNNGGTFTSPYATSGYVITRTIMPQSISKWGTLVLWETHLQIHPLKCRS